MCYYNIKSQVYKSLKWQGGIPRVAGTLTAYADQPPDYRGPTPRTLLFKLISSYRYKQFFVTTTWP
jgi:hypothetical protein